MIVLQALLHQSRFFMYIPLGCIFKKSPVNIQKSMPCLLPISFILPKQEILSLQVKAIWMYDKSIIFAILVPPVQCFLLMMMAVVLVLAFSQ